MYDDETKPVIFSFSCDKGWKSVAYKQFGVINHDL